jgi:PAT family beta-lactamase induction signal transducer AmpG
MSQIPKPEPRPNMLRLLFTRRMSVSLLMGFSCGLPLLLTIGVMQAWMKQVGVDLTTIGLTALVGMPYTLKFLWAPLLDRYTLPFLGRRRGWLLIFQLLLMAAIFGLGRSDPAQDPFGVAIMALLVTFFSASQDIVVDAYRREDLPDEELGLGTSYYVGGYRLGTLLAGGGGLVLADRIGFPGVYTCMAACMLVGLITTLLSPEPTLEGPPPRNLREAVIVPFLEFFRRRGAITMLLFILFYKVGDSMASFISNPFYLDIGFSNTEIGLVTKLFGFWMILTGIFLGGLVILKLGINRSLWIFGILQMVSTACFAILANTGYGIPMLAAVITFENLSAGMGMSALTAFMAAQTNKRYTATQFALLSSLVGVPRTLLSAPTGWLAEQLGWPMFFIGCTLIAIPGLLLLSRFAPWKSSAA